MILHRRLRSLLTRCGVSHEATHLSPEEWGSLSQILNSAFTRWDMETLQHERTAVSLKREMQALFNDLAAEHLKLESVLNALEQPLAGLDLDGQLLFASSGFERFWPAEQMVTGTAVLNLLSDSSGRGGFSNLEALVGSRYSVNVQLATPAGLTALQLCPTWNGGRLLGAVLYAAETAPDPVHTTEPAQTRMELFGTRLGLLLAESAETALLRQRLQGLGAAVLSLPPTRESLNALRSAGELQALLVDPAAWELTEALEQEAALAAVPLLAVVRKGMGEGHEVGSVRVDASPDELARALLELRAQGFPTEEQAAAPAGLRVLVVDDEPVTRMIVEECVLSLGHECHVAENGAQAWEMHSQKAFNVIISDWVMPSMTGVELCGMVRSHTRECYTYFILLTGKKDSPQVSDAVTEAGADDYLTKPLNPSDIERRLQVAARFAARERQLRNGYRPPPLPATAAGRG